LNVAAESGCGAESKRVWSSTLCHGDGGLVGHFSQAGSLEFADEHQSRCSVAEEAWLAPCCADVIWYPPSPPLQKLAAPESLELEDVTCTSVTVSWTGPNGPSTHFLVSLTDPSAGAAGIADPEAVQRTTVESKLTVGGLLPSTDYEVRVAANNALGPGAWSRPQQVRTVAPDKPPLAPLLPELVKDSDCSTLVLRVPPLRTIGCASDVTLALQKFSILSSWTTVQYAHSADVAVQELDPELAYTFRLVAYNQAGGSEPSPTAGPFALGVADRSSAAPRAKATSSATVSVSWAHLSRPCDLPIRWKVMVLQLGEASQVWRVVLADTASLSARLELSCPAGCSFKAMPLISGWVGWSNASLPVWTHAIPDPPDGALRLGMSLAASPDTLSIDQRLKTSFRNEIAGVLAISLRRVALVEARPLAAAWYMAFDIMPPDLAGDAVDDGSAADPDVEPLAEQLGRMVRSPESDLLLGEVTRYTNSTYGVDHMIKTDAGWAATLQLPPAHGSGPLVWAATAESVKADSRIALLVAIGFLSSAAAIMMGLLCNCSCNKGYLAVHGSDMPPAAIGEMNLNTLHADSMGDTVNRRTLFSRPPNRGHGGSRQPPDSVYHAPRTCALEDAEYF